MRLRNVIIIFALLLTAACAKEDMALDRAAPEAPVAQNAPMTGAVEEDGNALAGRRAKDKAPVQQRMVIQTADVSLVVDDAHQRVADIGGIVETLGGFVVSSSVYGQPENGSANVAIRVPADAFNQALASFRNMGDVSSETVTGEDVTEEFVDIQARLKVQKQLESRYLGLLAQSASIKDTLAVEQELARVRSEIERMEGRSQFLQDQVQMATIRINVTTPAAQGDSTFGEIGEAFADSGDIIVAVVAGAIRVAAALLPIGAILAFLAFAAVRLFSAIQRRRSNIAQ